LNVVVKNLEEGKGYALLRYKSFEILPKNKVKTN
jgi:hypothetical protein